MHELTARTVAKRTLIDAETAAPASSLSKDARAVRSALALREALLALLQSVPFEQITVRDICAEAGIHYSTFFRHHPTKESLLEVIARDQIAMLSRLAMATRRNNDYRAAFHAMCTYIDEHRDLWSTLLNGGASSAMREEWLRQSKQVAESEDTANGWLPYDLGTICAATLIAETLAWWVAQAPKPGDVGEVTSLLVRMLTPLITPSNGGS